MKKILALFAISFITLTAFSKNQNSDDSVLPVYSMEVPGSANRFVYDATSMNQRASRDFKNRYQDVAIVSCFSDHSGYLFYFVRDGYMNRVGYDKKGRWEYALIPYNENRLPRQIRNAVKSVYFDWSITLVTEVQAIEGRAYVVHMEDKTRIKIVSVNDDGEMKTLEEFQKS